MSGFFAFVGLAGEQGPLRGHRLEKTGSPITFSGRPFPCFFPPDLLSWAWVRKLDIPPGPAPEPIFP